MSNSDYTIIVINNIITNVENPKESTKKKVLVETLSPFDKVTEYKVTIKINFT